MSALAEHPVLLALLAASLGLLALILQRSSGGSGERHLDEPDDEAHQVRRALSDPTEKDFLAARRPEARRRVRRALAELARAAFGLLLAGVASRALSRAGREVSLEREGVVVGAEHSVLALERRLSGPLTRRSFAARAAVLRLFGASKEEPSGSTPRRLTWLRQRRRPRSLKLACRTLAAPGEARSWQLREAEDAPLAQLAASIGVRLSTSGELLWCVGRYAKERSYEMPGEQRWQPVCAEEAHPTAATALISFFSEKAPRELPPSEAATAEQSLD